MGDINIDLIKNEDNNTAEYLNILNEVGYISAINDPTRVQGTRTKYHLNKHTALLPNHQYQTRQRTHYVIPLMFKTAAQRSYNYYAPKIYNSIPVDLKSLPNKTGFKRALKRYLLQGQREDFLLTFGLMLSLVAAFLLSEGDSILVITNAVAKDGDTLGAY
ncbi:hypothetical protein NQ317_014503 [Molorchus minor]|uniref:Uncharacterized protein n=1 Tax=Molorchus minor TaxID=1323400 RepID=A0ABQ9JK39_9CUCU|nr:hypothetical protein NQ317_014503 [Molorchus minor]